MVVEGIAVNTPSKRWVVGKNSTPFTVTRRTQITAVCKHPP